MIGFQCPNCENYKGSRKCEAYPEEIPLEIFTGEHDHTKPYKGDNGVRFTQSKERKGS